VLLYNDNIQIYLINIQQLSNVTRYILFRISLNNANPNHILKRIKILWKIKFVSINIPSSCDMLPVHFVTGNPGIIGMHACIANELISWHCSRVYFLLFSLFK